MSEAWANDPALRTAQRIGNVLVRELPDMATLQAVRAAIIVARELTDLPFETAALALEFAERVVMYRPEEAGYAAAKSIATARDLIQLPTELRGRAVILGGEPTFAHDGALVVIDWAEHSGRAIFLYEVMQPDPDPTKVQILAIIGPWPECEAALRASDWSGYVACCARNVRTWIADWVAWSATERPGKYFAPANDLYNITWVSEEEARAWEKRDQS